jgi:hypothetical protein
MSWHYSQALVEAFSEGTCSGGGRSAPWKSRSIPVQFCSHVKMTGCFRRSRFGMISVHLTDDRGEALLTWFLAGFRARTSAPPERAQESPANGAVSGVRWRALPARYDRDSSSWKTALCLWEEDLPSSSLTLPKWGMMRDGELWERTMPEHLTKGTGFGLWLPTPTKGSGGDRPKCCDSGTTLSGWVQRQMYPPPVKYDATPGGPNNHYNWIGRMAKMETWPTPQKTDARTEKLETWEARRVRKDAEGINLQLPLSIAVQIQFPTPAVNDSKNNGAPSQAQRHSPNLNSVIGGQLNPEWVEWLMGWPIGWTELMPLATDKLQQWQRSHGVSSEVNDV